MARQKILHKKIHWIALVGFFFVLISTFLSCTRETEVAIDRFLGVWETAEPKYEDRFLEIDEATIAFGTGDGNSNIFFVDRVIQRVEENTTVYTISYTDVEGSLFKLAFYYSPEYGGVVRFKNQQEIEWTRIN